MKVTFIKPRISIDLDIKSERIEPLAIGILAALTPRDVETAFFDDRVEEISYDEPSDLVAISVDTFTAKRAYEISSEFRVRGIPVIMGGFHPTFMPDEALEYADSVVVGEAEGVWKRVIKDAKKEKLKKLYKRETRTSIVKPQRSIFQGKDYLPISLVEFGRGCRHSCSFCSLSAFYNHSHYHRSLKQVLAEIEELDKKHILFTDDNIAADPEAAKELFRGLIPLKINWWGQISVDRLDGETLDLIGKSGCRCLCIGFESLNKQNLKQMNKRWHIKVKYEEILKRIYAHGIMVWANFVFGYDHDTTESLSNTLEFVLKHKLLIVNFNQLNPLPGTRIYSMLVNQGRLIYKDWWMNPNYRYGAVVFQPKSISPESLTKYCWDTKFKFYSYSSILKRLLNFKCNFKNLANAGFFLFLNIAYRKDLIKKQYIRLGTNLWL